MIHDADFDLGRRLCCFSTSFGQGGFGDRPRLPNLINLLRVDPTAYSTWT
jgi:hypothetical protein